jgi:hypothetical protein
MSDRAAAAIADLVLVDAELRRPLDLCDSRAGLQRADGDRVICCRPRHPDEPDHRGVLWLYVGGRLTAGVVTWRVTW